MSSSADAIINRAVGQYPVSVATSLAIETLTNINEDHRGKFHHPPVADYQEVWINIKTLFRNLVGACDIDVEKMHVGHISGALIDEMRLIIRILGDYGVSDNRIVFYVSNYVGMEQKFKYATVRVDNTPKQKKFTEIYSKTVTSLLSYLNTNKDPIKPRVFSLELKPTTRVKTIILTHNAFDLTSHQNFGSLTLVESHTGNIKGINEWYTKYHGWREMPKMPWNLGLLQIFGDSECFRPMDLKMKKAIIEVAEKDHWTVVTTRERMRSSIGRIQNPHARAIAMAMV